jgi:hypothetical protein
LTKNHTPAAKIAAITTAKILLIINPMWITLRIRRSKVVARKHPASCP